MLFFWKHEALTGGLGRMDGMLIFPPPLSCLKQLIKTMRNINDSMVQNTPDIVWV